MELLEHIMASFVCLVSTHKATVLKKLLEPHFMASFI